MMSQRILFLEVEGVHPKKMGTPDPTVADLIFHEEDDGDPHRYGPGTDEYMASDAGLQEIELGWRLTNQNVRPISPTGNDYSWLRDRPARPARIPR